jgi:putative DNA primase/helicase
MRAKSKSSKLSKDKNANGRSGRNELRLSLEAGAHGSFTKNGNDDNGSSSLPDAGANLKMPLNFAQTDTGNAELFAAVWKNYLRYDHYRQRWLLLTRHWWSEDPSGYVPLAAKKAVRFRLGAATHIDDKKERKAEVSWARKSESRSKREAMLNLAQSECPLADDGKHWDSDPFVLGVGNGVVDLCKGKLREGKPSDRITLHSNIFFDPQAQCPRWIRFLEEIFDADQELVNYVHRAIGYSLTGDTREQCLFLCYGIGANGKSLLLEVLRHTLGSYAYNLPFSAFELNSRSAIPNDVAALDRRRFVTAIETNESIQLNEGRIKALTGCDPVTARFLYREFFTFIPMAKFWLAFNHKPRISDDSPGFWRRIRLIPFLQRFPEGIADKNLMEKLKAEAPGILAWAVRGALIWRAEGLGMPAAVKQVTEDYRKQSDPLEDFLTECCEIRLSPDARVAAGSLWDGYIRWANSNSERQPLDRRAFTQRLEAKGFIKHRVGHDRTWTWFGIALKADPQGSDPKQTGGVRADADVNSTFVGMSIPSQ